jgi:heptosyltransferase II
MKILIELPTWLGDAVMATPAIQSLINFFQDSQVTLIGSYVSIGSLKHHPKVVKTFILDKQSINLLKTVKSLGEFDVFISFRSSLRSKFMKFWIKAKSKYQFDKNKYNKGHQVEKYNQFIENSLSIKSPAGKLILYTEKKYLYNKKKKLLGINPGATYGSSKRWYPKEFANTAYLLSDKYDIVIFGGPSEKAIAKDIEELLIKKNIQNYQNLAGKTSINELIDKISILDLFITGDSGPMHIAAAFQIPTVSIFGPTNFKETAQWMNPKSKVISKNLDCQPCMKRSCPLNHHNCMKMIKSKDILDGVELLS